MAASRTVCSIVPLRNVTTAGRGSYWLPARLTLVCLTVDGAAEVIEFELVSFLALTVIWSPGIFLLVTHRLLLLLLLLKSAVFGSIFALEFSVILFHGNHRPGRSNEEWLVDVKMRDGTVDGRPDGRLKEKDLVTTMAHNMHDRHQLQVKYRFFGRHRRHSPKCPNVVEPLRYDSVLIKETNERTNE